jgi:hypothetical protein
VKDAPIANPWCTITVNGGTPFTGAVETVCVPTGATTLAVTPNTGFELDPTGTWHDTDGDHDGSGDQGQITGNTSTTTVTVTTPGTKCVWACCPFGAGQGCPTTDQCP